MTFSFVMFGFFGLRAHVDAKIEEYEGCGPLGSTDMKCPIDIDRLFAELNEPDSCLKTLWTEHQIKEWTRKLGGYSEDFTMFFFCCAY